MTKDKKEYRFLIIEDNPGDFVIVEDLLTDFILNPVIIHVSNYKQAAEILHAGDKFSAILLDLTLPDKNGEQLVTEILKSVPVSCPVIILTGYTDIDFSIKSISLGVMDYLLKDDLTAAELYKSIIYSIERKNNISEIKASEKRYSDLFNLSPQPMWLFDTETLRFVHVNNATVALYGYTEEEFLKMTLMAIKLDEDVIKARESLAQTSSRHDMFKETVMHQKKSGEIIEVEIYSTPIVLKDRNYRSVIAIDVTEKNLHEHMLIKAIIKTQEDERYEIGGELHDNVCQVLAASQMSLGMLKNDLPSSKINLFEMCTKNIALALEEIRNLSHRLAPVFFDDSTMEEAFTRLFDTFDVEKTLKVFLHFDKALKNYPISLEIQLNLYRILQEQLRNILKYAKASSIEVDVILHNNKLKMKISDNGVGFNVNSTKRGIGLANIKRRAELFAGKFEIHSSPGNGCEILIHIPLPVLADQPELPGIN